MSAPWFDYPEFHWRDKTVSVIGAGIAGRQVAWHLAQRGWQVTLLERHGNVPKEASGNLAGVISPKVTAKPSLGEAFYLQCYAYVLKQLAANPQWNSGWNPCGVLQLAHRERELARWQRLRERNFSNHLLQCLDPDEASKVAGITIKKPAIYFPQAGYLRPRDFCAALVQGSAINFQTYTEIIQLEPNSSATPAWLLTDSEGNRVAESEAVVICSGKDLHFQQLDIMPVKHIGGQTSTVSSARRRQQLQVVIDHEGYITPLLENEGLHIMGASYERDKTHIGLSRQADEENLRKQQRHLPELAEEFHQVTSSHAAIRTASPDRMPYAGAVPIFQQYKRDYGDLRHGRHWKHYPPASYYPGLFIAAAFASRGLTTTALCAKALANLMENEASPFSGKIMQSLHPARYLIRALKRGS